MPKSHFSAQLTINYAAIRSLLVSISQLYTTNYRIHIVVSFSFYTTEAYQFILDLNAVYFLSYRKRRIIEMYSTKVYSAECCPRDEHISEISGFDAYICLLFFFIITPSLPSSSFQKQWHPRERHPISVQSKSRDRSICGHPEIVVCGSVAQHRSSIRFQRAKVGRRVWKALASPSLP